MTHLQTEIAKKSGCLGELREMLPAARESSGMSASKPVEDASEDTREVGRGRAKHRIVSLPRFHVVSSERSLRG